MNIKEEKGRQNQMIENRLKAERPRVVTEKATKGKRDDKAAKDSSSRQEKNKASNTGRKMGRKPDSGEKSSDQKKGPKKEQRAGGKGNWGNDSQKPKYDTGRNRASGGNSNLQNREGIKVDRQPARKNTSACPVFLRCGGCQLLDMPYEKQLKIKQTKLEELLKPYCKVQPIIGMKDPFHYRNKVHAVFDHDKKGNPVSGVYEANTHRVVPVESCLIEDQKADEIIGTIRGMLKSFKIKTYDEDTGYGLLRHVLILR